VFLVLSLVFGSAFLVLTPPFQVPDEEAHFRRAIELSLGSVVPIKAGDYTGDYLPPNVDAPWETFKHLHARPEEKTSYDEIRETLKLTTAPGERQFVVFSNTAIHPPLTYLPQSLGIFVARQFSPSVLIGLYVGRFFNFLAWTALTFLAIRLTPVARWAFAALALTPMSLFLAASLSNDVLTNALSYVLIAYVLAVAFSPEERLSGRSIAVIALLGTSLGLAKQAYFLLPLVFLLIPVRKLGTWLRYILVLGTVMVATLLPLLVWGVIVRSVYSPPEVGPGFRIDPAEQFQRMITNKEDVLGLLRHTAQRWQSYGEEYLGFLGRLDTRLPDWVYLVQLGLLLIVSAVDRDSAPCLTGRQNALAGGIFLLVGLTVLFILHLTWDRIGSPYIVFQGRYFIPSAPLLAIVLSYPSRLVPRVRRAVFRFVPLLTLVAVPVILTAALRQVHDRYYVDNDFFRAERSYQRGRALIKEKEASKRDRGYELLEEAVRIDPDHPGANYLLGVSLQRTSPREAIKHLRAAMRRDSNFVPTRTELAALLANQFEFDEAIRLYEEALRLRPNDTDIAKALATVRANRKNVADIAVAFQRAMQSRLDATTTERRYAGTARDGVYLKANRGPVGNNAAFPLPGPCFWRCPPPSGREIGPLPSGAGSVSDRNEPFYACSEQMIGPKRVFLFLPPTGAVLLADEDVSWYLQLPLAGLSDEERQREEDYRKAQRLEFPLAKLPP
jgi:uncharacterized membrane protein